MASRSVCSRSKSRPSSMPSFTSMLYRMTSPQVPAILFCPLRAWARLSALEPMADVCSRRFLTACSMAVLREAVPSVWLRFWFSKLSCMALRSFPSGPARFLKVSSAFCCRASSRCFRSFSVSAESWLRTASNCWEKASCCIFWSLSAFSRSLRAAMSWFSRALQAFTSWACMMSQVMTTARITATAAAMIMSSTVFIGFLQYFGHRCSRCSRRLGG